MEGKAKEEGVTVEGVVTEALKGGKFRVELPSGHKVMGHLAGKLRLNQIKIVVGDKVQIELSPYDPEKGRITFRSR